MLEEVSGTGMLWPLLIIVLHRCHFFIFCKKNAKNEDRLGPLPCEEILEDIIKATRKVSRSYEK